MQTSTTFTTMDREDVRRVREIAGKALEAAFAATNIAIKGGHASFDPGSGFATIKFEFLVKRPDGRVESRESRDFKRYATMFGLEPEHFGRTVVLSGYTYSITGLASRSRRFPIIVTRSDGRQFKFPSETVRKALNGGTQ